MMLLDIQVCESCLFDLGSPFGESIWIYIVHYVIYKIPRNAKLVDLVVFRLLRHFVPHTWCNVGSSCISESEKHGVL